ncbi:hypothetical protein MPUL_26580 [Mycolicibacterium pulveris]|uniref:Uncharacterized protein n=1 Tax=Mycolicibacterium pulveris TaxID=36813 RepID=A0A7I7UK76_MYCPV|nr:hypothetical protein MPUL_26580 [Mycolicibacterium pulveris]
MVARERRGKPSLCHRTPSCPVLSIPRRVLRHLTDEQLLRHPGALSGSLASIADRLRQRYGISYMIVQAAHTETLANMLAELRWRVHASRSSSEYQRP